MKILFKIMFAVIFIIIAISCEETTGPNEIGGNTDLELTEVGNEFGVNLSLQDADSKTRIAFEQITDSVFITKSEGGIVTFNMTFTLNKQSYSTIDTLFGTYLLPTEARKAVLQYFETRFGVVFDTTDKNNFKIKYKLVTKITSEGIQDFSISQGDLTKPFTIMKYSCNVGDKYTQTAPDGEKITRTVIQKQTTEDWQMGFMYVKTVRVEQETPSNPLIDKITYIGNHKFGMVGLILKLKDGKILKTSILPWALL